MKIGLAYIFGIILTLIFISTEKREQVDSFPVQTYQSIENNTNTDCLLFDINFSLKKPFLLLTSLQIESLDFSSKLPKNQVFAFLNSFHRKKLNEKHFKKIPFRLILYISSDNSDSHSLV